MASFRLPATAVAALVLVTGFGVPDGGEPPSATRSVAPVSVVSAPLGIDPNRRYDDNTYLTAHNAYAVLGDGWLVPNQDTSITSQLDGGVRALNLDTYLVRQDYGLHCVGIYRGEATDLGSIEGSYASAVCRLPWALGNEPLQVVVAHEPQTYGFLIHAGAFRELGNLLAEVRQWMERHPREVVSITLQNEIHPSHHDLVRAEFARAGFSFGAECGPGRPICMFHVDADNVGMVVPDRPGEWWRVDRHGFPLLNHMADANRRLVLLPDALLVTSIGNGGSLDRARWTDPDPWSPPLDDHSRPLFVMQHQPCCPGLRPVGGAVTDYHRFEFMRERWEAINARWGRMPQFVQVDFFDLDGGHQPPNKATLANLSGPMRLVSHLNWLRSNQRRIWAWTSVNPAPNGDGWHTGDVVVDFGATDDQPRRYSRSAWGAQPIAPTTSCRITDGYGTCHAWELVTAEGVTHLGVAAIGTGGYGTRSHSTFRTVRIDRTHPVLTCAGNAGRYRGADPVAITCTATDALSGVRELSHPAIHGPACRFGGPGRVTIVVRAVDHAGNATEVPVTFRVDRGWRSGCRNQWGLGRD